MLLIELKHSSNLHNFSLQINFDSDNSLHCDMFDVDMKTGDVSCATGGTPGNDEKENYSRELLDRHITAANTKGPIIPLGKYYKNGIP